MEKTAYLFIAARLKIGCRLFCWRTITSDYLCRIFFTSSQLRAGGSAGTFRGGPESDAKAVPTVDRHDGQRQFR